MYTECITARSACVRQVSDRGSSRCSPPVCTYGTSCGNTSKSQSPGTSGGSRIADSPCTNHPAVRLHIQCPLSRWCTDGTIPGVCVHIEPPRCCICVVGSYAMLPHMHRSHRRLTSLEGTRSCRGSSTRSGPLDVYTHSPSVHAALLHIDSWYGQYGYHVVRMGCESPHIMDTECGHVHLPYEGTVGGWQGWQSGPRATGDYIGEHHAIWCP